MLEYIFRNALRIFSFLIFSKQKVDFAVTSEVTLPNQTLYYYVLLILTTISFLFKNGKNTFVINVTHYTVSL